MNNLLAISLAMLLYLSSFVLRVSKDLITFFWRFLIFETSVSKSSFSWFVDASKLFNSESKRCISIIFSSNVERVWFIVSSIFSTSSIIRSLSDFGFLNEKLFNKLSSRRKKSIKAIKNKISVLPIYLRVSQHHPRYDNNDDN